MASPVNPSHIPPCPPPTDVSLVPLASTPEEAERSLKEAYPQVSAEALCQKEGKFYARLDQLITGTKETNASQDPKDQLIFEVLQHRASLQIFESQVADERLKLAEALRTFDHLQRTSNIKKTPAEDILWNAGWSALSFGLVTEVFKDVAHYSTRSVPGLQKLSQSFEKNAQMRRIMISRGLCGPLQSPDGISSPGQLIRQSAPWIAAAGVTTAGVIGLNRWLTTPQDPISPATLQVASEQKPKSEPSRFSVQQLASLDQKELKKIKLELTEELAQKVKEQENLRQELKNIHAQLYFLYLGGLQNRNLQDIKDSTLDAYAEIIIAQGLRSQNPSFMEHMGIYDLLGIGLGFGIGTTVVAKSYHAFSPWQNFLEQGRNQIFQQAARDAETEINSLVDKGVLKSCKEENEVTESKPTEPEQATTPLAAKILAKYGSGEEMVIDTPAVSFSPTPDRGLPSRPKSFVALSPPSRIVMEVRPLRLPVPILP